MLQHSLARRLCLVLTVGLLLSLFSAMAPVSAPVPLLKSRAAHAAAITIKAPWDAGQTYAVGSPGGQVGGGYYGHTAGDYYAVDINGPGGGNADCGLNVRVTAPGKVLKPGIYPGKGYGGTDINYLRIDHGGSYVSEYQHMQSYAVAEGQDVAAGKIIGKIGSTGAQYCHLHFVVRLNGVSVAPSPMSGVNLPSSGGAWVTSDNGAVAAGSPEGSFDLIQRRPGGFHIAGWARDPDTSAAINVQAFVDGPPGSVPPSGTLNASLYRGDVGNHAYDGLIQYSAAGAHEVNVWAVNYGAGDSVNLGTKSITISHGAVGSLDTVRQEPGKIRVEGWALDWDTADPITLHVYVDSVHKGTLTAASSRPDIGNAFPGYGSEHGFNGTVDYSTAGTHSVCVWAINDGTAGDTDATQVQCKNLTINNDAVGSYDSLTRGPGGLRLGGWGLDRSLDGAASIHVYVDGVLKGALPANKPRPDVGKAYPGYGDNHGFDGVIPWTAAGVHQVCAWVVGDSLGGNAHLGCKSITVSNDPVGAYDSATGVSGGIRVSGWGIDPDTDNPLQVHVYRDGVFAGAYTANTSRPDVVSSTGPFPGFSTNHGFNFVVPSTPGSHSVCLWIIGVTPGAANQGLGCRSGTAS